MGSGRTKRRAVVAAVAALSSACSSGGSGSSATTAGTVAAPAPLGSTAPATTSAPVDPTTATVASSEPEAPASTAIQSTAPATTAPAATVTSSYECPTADAPDPGQPTEVTFWHDEAGTAGETIDALAAEYNAAHPEVRINSLYQDPQVAFVPAVTSGELPDLLSAITPNLLQLAIDSKVILPMGACLAADEVDMSDFLPRMLGATSKEGELWALPFFQTELVLYYNPLAFEAAGLDPAHPPATLDELHDASKQIVASGYTRHGVSWTTNSTVLQTLLSKSSRPFVDEDNGRSGRATQLMIGDETGLRAFTKLQEMVADGTATTASDRFDTLLAIGNRDAAMAIGALSYDLTNIVEAMSVQEFAGVGVGMSAMPSLTAEITGAADVRGESLFLIDGADPAKVTAAYRFALWLTEPAQQARLHVEANSVPVRASTADERSVTQYWKTQPLARVAFDDLQSPAAPPGGGGAILGPAVEVNELVTAAWTAASAPDADAAVILEKLVTDADAVIANYNALAGVDG